MKKQFTTEIVKQLIHEKYNGKISFPDQFEYTGVDDPATFICSEHGEFVSSVYRVKHKKSKYGCQKCSPFGPKDWNYKLNKFYQVHGNRYDYSLNNQDYSSREKLKIICKKHGVFKQLYGDHVQGNGCPKCYKEEKRITVNTFLYDSIKLHGNDYGYDYIFEDFKTSQSKVRIMCKKHGTFIQLANDHRKGVGCPDCKISSTGENVIKNYLIRHNIDFIPQKTFIDCIRNKRKCRFDFYIPSRNILIEYDGRQHFTGKFKEIDISDIKENDKFKNDYANQNNIPLYRIAHDEDVDKKLNKILELQ